MEKDTYRSVPFRFVVDQTNADICKLEKLTNLFPDIRDIIALELFKFNNFTQTVSRLSRIYTISSTVDIHDDTLHLFIGPYHLSLGPVTFGAMQFKNLSTALLASSHSKAANTSSPSYSKRRHDAALRRFRRVVRKLIQIKSIINKLQLASILTPYNQYKLYRRGIYDLVLAGHRHSADSIFPDDDFRQQMKGDLNEKNPVLASKFTKITTLLRLLSPSPDQSENNSTLGKLPSNQMDDGNENSSNALLNSQNFCCKDHFLNNQLTMVPINRSFSYQSAHLCAPESLLKRNSKSNSRRNAYSHSERATRHSLPDFPTDDTDKSKEILPVKRQIPRYQEDAFVNRISTLMTSYLLSQEPFEEKHESHSTTISNDEFDTLFKRIKTVVDQNLLENSLQTHRKSSTKRVKRKISLATKSQLFDQTNSQSTSIKSGWNDHSIEF